MAYKQYIYIHVHGHRKNIHVYLETEQHNLQFQGWNRNKLNHKLIRNKKKSVKLKAAV